MALAIFDLDNTLIRGDSDHAFGEFLVAEGVVDAEHYLEKNDYFYQQYQAGTLDIHEYVEFALYPFAKLSVDEITALQSKFLAERIEPILLDKAFALLQEHKDRGDFNLIISATNDIVVGPIAKRLGVDDYIATTAEFKDGKYTGKVAGTPSFQAGKITRLEAWLEHNPQSMTGSYFYSDSHNDLPLLKKVDHPVVVDADPTLLSYAEAQQWASISLR
ncbi:histidinol-phosphatase [Salinibius halmophilus]|uniref:histidinol-phosphatase n=1 Tax=Salinibius halmophilus TaxID=1853216 RepID=UPI000E66AB8D|nr:HAD family hydrolase [Salinibius halmophilus]